MPTPKQQRFPNFAKVTLAILEAKVESVIGKEAIKEIKAPLLGKEIAEKLLEATIRAESRLIAKYPEREVTDALSQLPIADLPSVKTAIWTFYENPTDPKTLEELKIQIRQALGQGYPEEKIVSAASDYLRYLWEEMASLPDIRKKLSAISIIRTERNTAEIADILRSIDERLASLTSGKSFRPQSDTSNIRSILATLPITPAFAHAQSAEIHWANRVQEIKALIEAWHNPQVRIVGLIGWGGIGKSTLARRWFDELYKQNITPDGFFWWSFYYQPSLDEFLEAAFRYLTDGKFRSSSMPSPWARIQLFVSLLEMGRFVFVLDGLEVMQNSQEQGDDFGRLEDRAFRNLVNLCADPSLHKSFVLITSRFPVTDLQPQIGLGYLPIKIDYFSQEDGAEYLRRRGIHGDKGELQDLSNEYGGHALSLSLLASYIKEYFDGEIRGASEIPFLATVETTKVNQLLHAYNSRLTESQRAFMQLLSAFRRPITHEVLEAIVYKQENKTDNPLLKSLAALSKFELRNLIRNLEERNLISRERNYSGEWVYTSHPIIREYFYQQLAINPVIRLKTNLQLREFALGLTVPATPQRLDDLAPMLDMVFYSCRAGLFDDAAQLYHDRMSHGQWELGFRFGAYEFQISFLREFFPDRDLSKPPQVTNPKAKPFLLNEIAYCWEKLGQLSKAMSFYQRSAEVALGESDYRSAAIAYQGIAEVEVMLGKLPDAQLAANKALEFSRLAKASLWECNALATQGWIAFLMGEISLAEQLYHEANTLEWSTNPEELGLFSILGVQYATFLLATGRVLQSLENTKRNLDICERRKWKESVAYCERLLGDIFNTENDFGIAIEHYTKALEISRNFGIQAETARILLGLAKIASVNGKLDDAMANLTSALEIVSRSSHVIIEVDIHNCLAELYLAQQNISEAQKQGRTALEIASKAYYLWGQGTALHILGQAAQLHGEQTGAIHFLEKAFTIRTQILDPRVEQTRKLLLKTKAG